MNTNAFLLSMLLIHNTFVTLHFNIMLPTVRFCNSDSIAEYVISIVNTSSRQIFSLTAAIVFTLEGYPLVLMTSHNHSIV
jgi:hypothetical protein